MKIIQIVLLVLIVLGIGLILTQKSWVPSLVSFILIHEGAPQVSDVPDTIPADSSDGMEKWNWVLSEVSPQGTQFLYPNPLPTRFVTGENWPPAVQMTAGEFSCNEDEVTAGGLQNNSTRKVIGNKTYCFTASPEGAAGSTYTSYEYSTKQGDFVTTVTFTLRTPQCMNYDEPERSACSREQEGFDTDALASRIATSLRMQ